MSCQIRLTANISDVASVRRSLIQVDEYRGADKDVESWLQQCEISVSSTGDIIVLAHKTRIVILTAKWNSSSSLSQFIVTHAGSVHDSDNITSVLCLPIVGQSQSSHIGPDWTCIMLGFESGHIRFYTENCELLMEEQLHNESIVSLKCQSQHSPRPDIFPDIRPEEVYVHYLSNICVIPGTQLFPMLRNCRMQLARVHAKGDLIDMSQTPLNPKKWGFQDQATVNDAEVVGLNLTNTFDHLMTASICGGFDAKYRAMPPHNNLVVAVGSKPFVGFHYALEGGVQPVLTDVAKAVASKLKSALPGWLSLSRTMVERQMTVAMQPSEPMGCRFGLCDLRRIGNKIILSPDHKLAAISDALGRVMLIDTFRGVILRIFKGYRDAQCSFMQVPEEKKSKFRIGNRVALFLVIYTPRKGTIEIFTVQQGTKVTTFTASKYSKLLYINYGLMGYATTVKSRYICQFTTVLIDSDGQMKEIVIPFHYALAEKNNKRAKDIHHYKKLKQLIRSADCDIKTLSAEVYNTCTQLNTVELMSQTLEMLISNKDVPADVLLKCVEHISDKVKDESSDPESSNLKVLCENLKTILDLYIHVTRVADKNVDIENGNIENIEKDASSEKNKLDDTKLNLGAKELNNLQRLLDLTTLNDDKKKPDKLVVKFFDTKNFPVSEFLSAFELTRPGDIDIKANVDEVKILKVAEILFKKYISGNDSDFDGFQEEIIKSKIPIRSLFKLLINYWVERVYIEHNMILETEMQNLCMVINALAKSTDADKEDLVVDSNTMSEFWMDIRKILADAPRPFPVLVAAMSCKVVALNIQNQSDLAKSDRSSILDNPDYVMLTEEYFEWSMLISKFEDLSLLNIILQLKPVSNDCTLPPLNHDQVNISLKYILGKGSGSVSELVAKWLASVGINPESIYINDLIYKEAQECERARNVPASSKKTKSDEEDDCPEPDHPLEQISQEKIAQVKSQRVFDHLNLMKKQFPYSLEADRLLGNMCWEYALAWQKDIQNLALLEAAIKCLTQVGCKYTQRGLYGLLWSTNLKMLFENTCKLINKVGKLPKERLCRQDTGLADYQLTLFLEICTNFLDSFLFAIRMSLKLHKPRLQYEDIFEDGKEPLIELALQNSNLNYELIHLHYELSLCLQMMTTLYIKQTKPLNNLFETSIVPLFFTDFHKRVPVDLQKTDTKLNLVRTQFLTKVIQASLETVSVSENNEVYVRDHMRWMSKCIDIATIWDIDRDALRRYQVVNLFANGYDRIGLEMLPMVNEPSKLGPELLAVAGKRLAQYLSTCENYAQKYPAMSTMLTEYLETLNSGYHCAPSSLCDLRVLAINIMHCVQEKSYEGKLVDHLISAVSILMDLET